MSSKYICRTKLINDPRVCWPSIFLLSSGWFSLKSTPSHIPRLWGKGEVGALGEEGHLEEQQQSSQQRSIEAAIGHRQPHRLLPRTGQFFPMHISSNDKFRNKLTNYRHALDMFRWWSRLQSQPVWNPLNSFTWDRLTPSTGLWVILRIVRSIEVFFKCLMSGSGH